MKVVLVCTSKFHMFDLARQLHRRAMLQTIFTGYPLFKLKHENLPLHFIKSFPVLQTLYMARGRLHLTGHGISEQMALTANTTLDAYTAARLPACDVFMALSNSGLKAGRKAKKRGAVWVCDRPCSHIRYQDALLRDEYGRSGLKFQGIDARIIAREEQEYQEADAITVGSNFARRSFLEMGFSPGKVHCVPYGVDLSRFEPVGTPDDSVFEVLFVGAVTVRKGVRYLLEAFEALQHPRKRLTIVGSASGETTELIASYAARLEIRCTGHVPQPRLKEIMSRSHVMVLPSVEEGLAMVQAQALACGCPVIGTTNSGAEDLLEDGCEGFIAPIRDAQSIADRLQMLADSPALRARMSEAALKRVRGMGGWDQYGQKMAALFALLVEEKANLSKAQVKI